MYLININTIILSISWRTVHKQQISVHWEWVAVAMLCIFSIYLVLRSSDFILSRLYWTSWKPATAMMGLLVAAYACKKAVDLPQPVASHMLPVSTRMIDVSVNQGNGESVKQRIGETVNQQVSQSVNYDASLENNYVSFAIQN